LILFVMPAIILHHDARMVERLGMRAGNDFHDTIWLAKATAGGRLQHGRGAGSGGANAAC
jgi:hypothetical protein